MPHGVQVYEINGPFFFGAAEMFKETLGRIADKPRVLVLRMRHVPAIDSTGIHALRDVITRSHAEGTRVVLSGVHAQPMAALARSGLLDHVGDDNVLGNIDDALNRVRALLGLEPVASPFAEPPAAPEPAGRVEAR